MKTILSTSGIIKTTCLVALIPLIFILTGCTQEGGTTDEISVIPKPLKMEVHKGHFHLLPETNITIKKGESGLAEVAGYLSGILKSATGYGVEVEDRMEESGENPIIMVLEDKLAELGAEGYELHVTRNRIDLKAYKAAGLFYGIQTLVQLLPPEIFHGHSHHQGKWTIPAVYIYDKPEYSWRGMHLDVSRHFFPVEFIYRYIDLIAMHKMNVFHWHLTDDNGWRIEIEKYPLLTEISAWRVDREDQPWREVTPPEKGEEATYGGYYTQQEIKDVVEYARKRHITVIPEIEMPGHTSEVFAAYPQLSCRGEKLYVQPGSYWPNLDIFCAGNDSVFVFLEDVLTEVIELFPSEYVHIGGDEADKTRWRACKKCQRRIKDEGLANEDELQSYFIKRIEKFLNEKGKKLIGWDEILEGGLAPDATVMSWRGFEGGIEAAEQGHDVIMCPVSHCYFDYYQANPEFEPVAIGGFTTLKKVYSFEPTPTALKEKGAEHVLGGQGNVWTEFIATPEHAEYMALPRMTALAEVLWTADDQRCWDDFNKRLQTQFLRFDQMGANYCKGSFAVNIRTEYDTVSKNFMVDLSSEIFQPEIRFTLDGTDPDVS
jgi:hexosaminidase